jgi:predicted ATP-grasp superfamily ATP-dependent carboligase
LRFRQKAGDYRADVAKRLDTLKTVKSRMEAPRAALILDAALRQSLVATRALGRAGIPVVLAETHPGAPAFASRWCSRSEILPDFTDDPDRYVDAVIALCEQLSRPVVITSHDGAIAALRGRRIEVERVATLALGPEHALERAIDKRSTLAAGERLGAAVPRQRTVEQIGDAPDALAAIGLPVVIKPAFSWVSGNGAPWRASVYVATNREQALGQIAQFLEGGVPVLLQQWLSGPREAISLLYASDRVWATFAQLSMRERPLIGGVAAVRESEAVPADIGPLAEALVRGLSLEGYSQVEFRRDAQGRPFLMEINSRLSESIEIAQRAGVNFPLLLYSWAAGLPLEPVTSYRCGERMRWLKGDVEWLKEALRNPEHPDAPPARSALGTFIGEFARAPGYDYWDRGDLGPAVVVTARTIRSLPPRALKLARRSAARAEVR